MISFKSWLGPNPVSISDESAACCSKVSGTSPVNEDQRPVAHSLSGVSKIAYLSISIPRKNSQF